MSGRPSRNCKRRTASEMLGKSPSSNKKSSSESTPGRPAKKAKVDTKRATEKPAVIQSKEDLQDVHKVDVTSIDKADSRSKRAYGRRRVINTSPQASTQTADPSDAEVSSTVQDADPAADASQPVERVSSPSNEDALNIIEEPDVAEEMTSSPLVEPLTEDTDQALTPVDEASEPTSQLPTALSLTPTRAKLADAEMPASVTLVSTNNPVIGVPIVQTKPPIHTIVTVHPTAKLKKSHHRIVSAWPEPADACDFVIDVESTSDPIVMPIPEAGDNSLTILGHGGKDCTTLPERTEPEVESELMAFQNEEVILTDDFGLATLEQAKPEPPKKKMLITANFKQTPSVKTKETPLPAEETGVALLDIPEPTIPTVHTGTSKPPAEISVPVTKTYIVGKNNQIQEVIVGPSTGSYKQSSHSLMEQRAGESDDEEFEYEDEFERMKDEGLDTDEALVFCERLPADYDMEDIVFSVFQRVKPQTALDDFCTLDASQSIYKCKRCFNLDIVVEMSSRMEVVKHLVEMHVSDYAPWHCPICQFKCMYPVALMMHMGMHTKNKPFKCDQCDKSFAYRHKLDMHVKYHDDTPGRKCGLCKDDVFFHEQSSLERHVARRHRDPPLVIYEGDNKSIIEEGDTSFGDALQMLSAGGDGENATGKTDDSQMFSVERGSIKLCKTSSGVSPILISDLANMVQLPAGYVAARNGSGNNPGLPISVVAESDIIGNPNSVVQIMPVSFRNDSGLPETINVVITVPPNEEVKLLNSANKMSMAGAENWMDKSKIQMNATDWATKNKMNSVDKELLNHCEVLDQPIHYRNQRAFIKCKECAAGAEVHFGSVTQFCEHLRKDHSDKDIKPYKCQQCEYRCRVKGNLDQHIKFHSTERPFTCTICGKGFIQKYKLNLHLKFHDNKREWVCTDCGSAFNDKQDLSRHGKNVHFNKEEGVPCPHCDRVFKNDYMLSQHIHVHTGERNYHCDICDKPYSTKESLRSHMKGHQFQFGCEICAKPLGSYSAFIAHKRLHDPNQKGYTCDHCGKVLLFKATLEAHIKSVHSDEKDFRCEQCDKGFKTQAQLNNHKISHTKEKPYLCQICGYAVKRKDSLRQHMYRHAEVKPYRCGRCGKEYTQKQALEIHLKSKHAGVTTFNCTMCERGFNTNYLLKKHMQKVHEVELVNKAPKHDQVIIAQQQMEDAADSEPPAPDDTAVLPPLTKKQTVLINAHICEHCHEVFVSQHALAVHILSEHMSQTRLGMGDDDPGSVPTNVEDGQVVNISETIEIPIGEEMVLVQSVEPGVLSAAVENGDARVVTSVSSHGTEGTEIVTTVSTTSTAVAPAPVSLLTTKHATTLSAEKCETTDEFAEIVVRDAGLADEPHPPEEDCGLQIIEVSGAVIEDVTTTVDEVVIAE